MPPEQPQPPAPGNHYDFIMSPQKPQKPPILGNRLGRNPFLAKIILIVGGAVVLMIVMTVLVNLLFGGRAGLDTLASLAQTEQEITRLGEEGGNSSSATIKNAAVSTAATVETHKQEWLAYLSEHGRNLDNQELGLKRDTATDTALESAIQTSTFDTTYTTVMRSQLTDYADMIESAYNNSSVAEQRQMLIKHFGDVELLLKQWPE